MVQLTVDKGWAWVIAFSSFWTMLTCISIQRTSGVLYTAMMNTYGASREEAAWPFFLRKTVGMFTSTVVGIFAPAIPVRIQILSGLLLSSAGVASLFFVNDMLSVITLFGILYGIEPLTDWMLWLQVSVQSIMRGFGSGVVGMCNIIVINKFFSRYRTVALGITFAGTSAGAFVLPPLLEYAIDKYCLKGSYLILTGVIFQGFVVAIFYRAPPAPPEENKAVEVKKDRRTSSIASFTEEIRRRSFETAAAILDTESPSRRSSINYYNERPVTPNSIVEDERPCLLLAKSLLYVFSFPMFHVIWITFMLFDFGFYTFLTVIVDHGIDCGIDKHKAVFFLSASSIAELCGRLGGGFIVDLKIMKRKTTVWIAFLIVGLIFAAMPFVTNYIVILVLTGAVGFVGSCLAINATALYADYLGLDYLPLSLGAGATVTGLMSLVTPRIIGYIRDTTGSYSLLYFIFSGLLVLSAVLWLAEPLFMKCKPPEPITCKKNPV